MTLLSLVQFPGLQAIAKSAMDKTCHIQAETVTKDSGGNRPSAWGNATSSPLPCRLIFPKTNQPENPLAGQQRAHANVIIAIDLPSYAACGVTITPKHRIKVVEDLRVYEVNQTAEGQSNKVQLVLFCTEMQPASNK